METEYYNKCVEISFSVLILPSEVRSGNWFMTALIYEKQPLESMETMCLYKNMQVLLQKRLNVSI